jgi:hypothetical protein
MAGIFERIGTLGHKEDDREELRIQKGFLVYLAIFMSVGGLVWGTISLSYGLIFQSIFPYSYVIISFFNLLYFNYSKNIRPVRFIQVLISLSLPFLFQWSLGGFSSSGVIMLWAILALIASLSFQSIKTSVAWLYVYLFLTLASAFFDNELKAFKPEILPDNSIIFVVINLTLISSIVFGLVVFFVKKYKDAEKNLEKERDNLKRANYYLRNSHNTLKNAYKSLKANKEKLESQVTQDLPENNQKQLAEYEKILEEQKEILKQYEINRLKFTSKS